MRNPRTLYVKPNEEVYVVCGKVCKITDRNSYASVMFLQDETNTATPQYISVMCFANNGNGGVNHKSVAMKAEEIRNTLTGDNIVYATIVATKQVSPEGKINYVARSTSFCVSSKNNYFTPPKNPYRLYLREGEEQNVRLMSGFITGVFDNEKYKSVSFRADTNNKDAGYVASSLFTPKSENVLINNYENAERCNEMLKNGNSVHAVVISIAKEYNGKTYYNAIFSSFAQK